MRSRFLKWPVILTALVGGILLCACRHPGTGGLAGVGSLRTFQVKGQVKEIAADRKTVVVQHEEVPGYMPAMTMPFEVKTASVLAGLRAGDKIQFRLSVTAQDGWIDEIKVLEAGSPVDPKPVIPSVRRARMVDELHEGDLMPDYRFTNELRQAVSLRQFKAQALGLTFIYTRCPYPTFCPRMSHNFADAAKLLTKQSGGPKNWHLLSISFDPEHDTPSTLRSYARQYGYDPRRWSFLTGAIVDLDAITEQFGLYFARSEQVISHNSRTVVIDARGRVQRILVGNEWKVEDFVAEMTKAARAK